MTTQRNTTRNVLICLGLLAVVAVCFPPFHAVLFLFVGWIAFIVRTAPKMTIDWPSVIVAGAALVAFLIGSHLFFRSFGKKIAEITFLDENVEESEFTLKATPWKSIAVSLLLIALFTAGISMIGMTHQIIWLFSSDQPMFAGGAREAARRSSSSNNLHQIAIGVHNYADVHNRLPVGGNHDERGRMLHGWQTRILPFVEQRPLYEQIDMSKSWSQPPNDQWFAKEVHSYRNPGQASTRSPELAAFAVSDYSANVLVLGGEPRRFKDLSDGTTNTILSGEVVSQPAPWGSPTNWRDPRLGINSAVNGFGGPWAATPGASFAMADGSTRFVNEEIDPRVLAALATPDGGEKIDERDLYGGGD